MRTKIIPDAAKAAVDFSPAMGRNLFAYIVRAKEMDLSEYEVETAYSVYVGRIRATVAPKA